MLAAVKLASVKLEFKPRDSFRVAPGVRETASG